MMKSEFDEHKVLNPECAMMQKKITQKAMSTRWEIIQHVNKFYGVLYNIRVRPESGSNVEGQVK
jgi:hypothetical protein